MQKIGIHALLLNARDSDPFPLDKHAIPSYIPLSPPGYHLSD
jgi:hypothetical protein